MTARILLGAAIATVLVGAVIGTGPDAGNRSFFFWLLVALALAPLFVYPLGPFIPVLREVPFVGSPRIKVIFRLDGKRDLSMQKRSNERQVAILEIEIKNRESWTEVEKTWINILFPAGILVYRCNQTGLEVDEGSIERFTLNELGRHTRADYWAIRDVSLLASLTQNYRFRLEFDDPGTYAVHVKIGGSNLSETKESETIRIHEVEKPDPHSRLGELIFEGEAILDSYGPLILQSQKDEIRRKVSTFLVGIHQAATDIGELHPDVEPLPKNSPANEGWLDKTRRTLNETWIARAAYGKAMSEPSGPTNPIWGWLHWNRPRR